MRASSANVSRRMARTSGRDNPREREIRSALHRRGLRFRTHYAAVPGTKRTIDIAFTRLRLAVFCDGCFWHGCPVHATTPKSNREWWVHKINTNRVRDRDTNARLMESGWKVLRIWGHVPTDQAVDHILAQLERLNLCELEHEKPRIARSLRPNEQVQHCRSNGPSC